MYICNRKSAVTYLKPIKVTRGSAVFVTGPNGERNRTYERVLMLQIG